MLPPVHAAALCAAVAHRAAAAAALEAAGGAAARGGAHARRAGRDAEWLRWLWPCHFMFSRLLNSVVIAGCWLAGFRPA